jgi:hypothetical protein
LLLLLETRPRRVQGGSKTRLPYFQEIWELLFCFLFLILHSFDMVLSTTGRVSRAEILQQRLAANPIVQAGFEESLEDTHHYRILVQALTTE